MKISINATVLLIMFLFQTHAAELKYPVTDIPIDLLENADAVVRIDEGYFQVLSPGKAVSKSRYAITILNKNADFRSRYVEYYSKSVKISKLTGRIYNSFGKLLKTININDFEDLSAYAGYALYADTRLKTAKPVSSGYPYTVEYEMEKSTEGLLFYQNWYFIPGYRVAVQHSKYVVEVPANLDLRFKPINFYDEPGINKTSQKTQYTWEYSNIVSIVEEPYSPPFTIMIPHILFGANEFEMGGYKGNMSSWNDFGIWVNKLKDNLDALPANTIVQLQEIVKNCSTDIEKVEVLYRYLQKKVRYVGVFVGIGGWQPFAAKLVDEVGYGDCKALSNYMISILHAVGIKANYILIRAGEDESEINADFPSQQFNHVIVNVPLEKDTIWLECTGTFSPFGYLGTFTDNRYACMVNENGGAIVRTPIYPKDSNLFIHRASVQILPDGNAVAKQSMTYKSLYYDKVSRFLIEDADQQKRWLFDNIKIPVFNITNFTSHQYGDRFPTAVITQIIDLPGYATKTGERIFVPLKMMDREIGVPRKLNDRKSDIYIKREYIRTDTIRYILPDGYKVEFIPEEFKAESVFGTCCSKVIQDGTEILYIRRSENNRGTFPKTEYNNMIDYYRQIAKADKAQMVLVKK